MVLSSFVSHAYADSYTLVGCSEKAEIRLKAPRNHPGIVAKFPYVVDGDILEVTGSPSELPHSMVIGDSTAGKLRISIDKIFDTHDPEFNDGVRTHQVSDTKQKDNGDLKLVYKQFIEGKTSRFWGKEGNPSGTEVKLSGSEKTITWDLFRGTDGKVKYKCSLRSLD